MTMKKLYLLATIAAVLMMGSCGNNGKQQQSAATSDTIEVVEEQQPISVYGTCGQGSAMNTLQIITDSGDTLNLILTNAKDSMKVYGGYDNGDRMAVLLESDHKTVRVAINTTTLLGDWWQPNPIDGTSYMGIRLKDGGTAESLDQNGIVYKSWKIEDGKLVLTCYREGGVEEDETEAYTITKLDGDSLVFSQGEDDINEYGRKHTRKADI